jgi:uncharacterized protein (DUF1778 family)
MQTIAKETQRKMIRHKAEHLHIRASEQDKKTLAQAAQIKNLSVSRFLLQTALPVAEEIVKTETPELEDVQTIFSLEEKAWQEFNRLLDAPPRPLPALRKLLLSKPVWESGAGS